MAGSELHPGLRSLGLGHTHVVRGREGRPGMHLRFLTRLCLVALVYAGLCSSASAGTLRCDLPLNRTGAVPLRIAWDGHGELLVTTRPAYGRPNRFIVTRQGAGARWLALPDTPYALAQPRLMATVQQRVGGRVVAEEAVYAERRHITALWLGRPDLDTKQRKALAGLWPSGYDDTDLAVGDRKSTRLNSSH